MKKITAAFAVLAIVGSALAFKPFNGQNLYLEDDTAGVCDHLAVGRYVIDITLPGATQGRLGTQGPCQILKVKRDDN